MSQYEELNTTMTDQQYLVEALAEMGYKPEVQTEGMAFERVRRGQLEQTSTGHNPEGATSRRFGARRLRSGRNRSFSGGR